MEYELFFVACALVVGCVVGWEREQWIKRNFGGIRWK